jgi:hypothetical protein
MIYMKGSPSFLHDAAKEQFGLCSTISTWYTCPGDLFRIESRLLVVGFCHFCQIVYVTECIDDGYMVINCRLSKSKKCGCENMKMIATMNDNANDAYRKTRLQLHTCWEDNEIT